MTADVEPRLKPDGYGPCECETLSCREATDVGGVNLERRYGRLRKPKKDGTRHIYDCRCRSCTNKRSPQKGDRKALIARKVLGIEGVNSRHEEVWGGSLRVEIKAGKQISPAVTAFKKCEAQSEAARSVGDVRPFAAVWMPDGSSDGVLACNLSDAYDVAVAILENRVSAS